MRNGINVLLVLALLTFSSCSLFRNSTKTEVTKKVETSLKVDSSTEAKVRELDKTETVIVEKAKGTAYTPQVRSELKVDLTELLSGLQVVQDSGVVRVIQTYDSLTKTINTQVQVAPQPVAYDVEKTTTIKSDVQTETETKTKLKTDEKAVLEDKDKKVKTDTKLPYILSGLAALAGALFFGYKKFFK